ncbi:MAG TPA: L,D-transpeptidase [Pirellulaceae bacterium]|nr:L,D-transpeptidase [Pirellulaceae bacterium]
MNTLKSAALVVILAGVLYGVYITLHHPPAPPPPGMTQRQVDEMGPPQVEEGAAEPNESGVTSDDDRRALRDAPPLTENVPSLYGAGDVTPAATESSEASPADPPASPAGRSISHTGPVPDDRAANSVYNVPLPGESAAGSVSSGGSPTVPGYDAQAVARRLAVHTFKRDWEKARQQIDGGEFRSALATLTPYHGHPDLPAEHQAQLMTWLDALAAKVIYSREHLLAAPYKVRGTKARMIDVAAEYGVSAQLLQNINAQVVNNPDVLLPGTELKVVPGPFRAEVSLTRHEITVYLNDLYAGRFPFTQGDEPAPPGQYQVQRKQMYPTYVGADGRTVAGNDPANPYGSLCLHLGSEVRIHGSPAIGASGKPRGCISLSPRDADDLCGILVPGSVVVIR